MARPRGVRPWSGTVCGPTPPAAAATPARCRNPEPVVHVHRPASRSASHSSRSSCRRSTAVAKSRGSSATSTCSPGCKPMPSAPIEVVTTEGRDPEPRRSCPSRPPHSGLGRSTPALGPGRGRRPDPAGTSMSSAARARMAGGGWSRPQSTSCPAGPRRSAATCRGGSPGPRRRWERVESCRRTPDRRARQTRGAIHRGVHRTDHEHRHLWSQFGQRRAVDVTDRHERVGGGVDRLLSLTGPLGAGHAR